ncbi:MAG: preprotein translocase subunit SecA [Patescibacteria group bacterium]|nr:preprotein translocase subunit SecA [Patescibacteria group bacterium]
MSLFKKILGDSSSKTLKALGKTVTAINGLEGQMSRLDQASFPAETAKLRARLQAGETTEDVLPEAFALVREAAKRTLNQRHYDVQLLGGIVLHRGKITEMKTGEGKTLVCTLPAYLNALTGEGVHVVTVNDYLSRRDAAWMGQIYALLGLSVGVLNHESAYLYDSQYSLDNQEGQAIDRARDTQGSFKVFYDFLKPCGRGEAYLADITYGTNNEFGFDYLRDNLAHDRSRVVQLKPPERPRHYYAIIDEVDSILIDEARTPLIISAPVAESESLYGTFAKIARELERETDFTTDEKSKSISLTDEGIEKVEKKLGVDSIYTDKGIKYVHHLETAVRAKAIFERDKDYVVRDGEVMIVDEFTGRLQPGRRWSEGLHQAIEAKEGVAVRQESRTFASITYQNYFKLYKKVAGMTGTAATSDEEFQRVYGLDVVVVPTNKPSRRKDLNDLIFQTEAGKLKAIARKIKELNEKGQPVLVGTISIEKNELISAYLQREGVPHRLLNAKKNEEEGAVVAEAGKKGSVVVATNMAGRGVDIKLGGVTASTAEQEEVRQLGGLFVLGTERHEARRIDNQLRGRSGRQGDLGATQFYISLEDDLSRVFASDRLKSMMGRFGIPEDEPITHKLVSKAVESAQSKIEGLNFDLRKHLLDYDNVLNHQRSAIYRRRQALLFGGPESVNEFFIEAPESLLPTNLTAEEKAALRPTILQVIDMHWVEHLEAMEYMRGSVRLRAYGQRDPLVEYKREGLKMFREMEQQIWQDAIDLIPRIRAGLEVKTEAGPQALREVHKSVSMLTGGSNEGGSAKEGQSAPVIAPSGPRVGRNEPCPCGSGKKYKHCGLVEAPEHKA